MNYTFFNLKCQKTALNLHIRRVVLKTAEENIDAIEEKADIKDFRQSTLASPPFTRFSVNIQGFTTLCYTEYYYTIQRKNEAKQSCQASFYAV